ncbi:ABC transporter permease [Pseudonocardia petroleophila]|uniref:ABC transporter permease n=1 Tax=Pseudonocardia petroleophila TaxID=37331 RepID=A0A7G7MLX6_9PSEU|nr:ABC transporter permease [Pseudonocardia petroleophila]QNG53787.1 ABC transporter permease [Pseudonocardia petroleophila]
MGLDEYVVRNSSELLFRVQQHFLLVAYAVGLAALIAVALGVALHTTGLAPPSWSTRFRAGSREALLLLSSVALTIPSLALFGVLQPALGLGATPSLVALTIYGVYPILRNVVAGLSSVDSAVLDSARGMGMGPVRRMVRIQFPLAWPVILSGIRVAMLILIGIAVVAAIVSGPGLGQLLFAGLARLGAVNSFNQVVVGTFGCLLVAAVYEIVFALVGRLTTPRGIRA